MMFNAKQRVWIVTPYFVPDEMLIKAICIAAKRGVDVRILVPLASNHRIADLVRRSYLRQMQESGATVYKFMPGMMHGKAILIDDGLAVVGSMNMDLRSFFLNYEIALYIYDKAVVKKLDSWVSGLMNRSSTGIRTVCFGIQMIEGAARLLAPLL
jgi:cardiolipin synthase